MVSIDIFTNNYILILWMINNSCLYIYICIYRFGGHGYCYNYTKVLSDTLLPKHALKMGKPNNVTMHMFWGPFVFLLIGVVISSLAMFAEIYYFKQTGKVDDANGV